MSTEVHVERVGQFWHPHRVSMRKVEKALARLLPQFVVKPRVRLLDNPEYGQFMFVWSAQ